MTLLDGYLILLCISLLLMLYQLTVKNKQLVHILFTILCGSIAMAATQKLSVGLLGHYNFLIGMGACLTCNVSWLIARKLFRAEDAVKPVHLLFAGLIALLVISNQGLSLYQAIALPSATTLSSPQQINHELLNLLSSAVLVLTFWEACRGWSRANKEDKQIRLAFLFLVFHLSIQRIAVIKNLAVGNLWRKHHAMVDLWSLNIHRCISAIDFALAV